MSLIACLGECKYQKDGYCKLENVKDWDGVSQGDECVYFVPHPENNDQST